MLTIVFGSCNPGFVIHSSSSWHGLLTNAFHGRRLFFPSLIYMNLNLVVFLFLLNSFYAVSLFLLSPVIAVWFLKWSCFSLNPVWPCWASRLTQKAVWEQQFPWLSSLSQTSLPSEKVEHSSSLRLCSSYLIKEELTKKLTKKSPSVLR